MTYIIYVIYIIYIYYIYILLHLSQCEVETVFQELILIIPDIT